MALVPGGFIGLSGQLGVTLDNVKADNEADKSSADEREDRCEH
jgi:hypothetical protein